MGGETVGFIPCQTVGSHRASTSADVRERRSPAVVQNQRLLRGHGRERAPATTAVARRASPPHSTAHPARRSARGVGPTRRRDSAQPPRAREGGASLPPDVLAGSQGPFFSCL